MPLNIYRFCEPLVWWKLKKRGCMSSIGLPIKRFVNSFTQ